MIISNQDNFSIASLLTHILATGWGGFQIAQTDEFRKEFNRMTTDGACGINLLSSYWQSRANAEIPSLALNALSLLLSLFLSWRLFKVCLLSASNYRRVVNFIFSSSLDGRHSSVLGRPVLSTVFIN